MKRRDLCTYGPRLPGVRGGKLRGPMVSTATGFMDALKKYRAVSDAGDYGAVMVWRDDVGAYRCQFCVWRDVLDSQVFKTKAQVRKWLNEWLPKQRQQQVA